MSTPPIDLDRLLKLRLVVARFGEMDLARWWNTKGQLGRLGTTAAEIRKEVARHEDTVSSALATLTAHRLPGGAAKKRKKGRSSA